MASPNDLMRDYSLIYIIKSFGFWFEIRGLSRNLWSGSGSVQVESQGQAVFRILGPCLRCESSLSTGSSGSGRGWSFVLYWVLSPKFWVSSDRGSLCIKTLRPAPRFWSKFLWAVVVNAGRL
uniref:Uncharacterized protein n=1 Tax=Cannabis sativa TaxID=3483 RepID=A0A803P190_CANSA